jgi:2-C-methyl-D-erythritol 4-phosphate cytidylyltransferase
MIRVNGRESLVIAVIPAAGTGSRSGLKVSKAFYSWKGKTILERTLERFQSSAETDGVLLLLHRNDMKKARLNRLRRICPKLMSIIPGGVQRKHTVFAGLEYLERVLIRASQCMPESTPGRTLKNALSSAHKSPACIVMIHDAARPFIDNLLIRRCLAGVERGTGSIPVLPVVDTLKSVRNGFVKRTLDRSDIVEVQTPQCFFLDELLKAYRKKFRERSTDDAGIFELAGGRVRVVEGSRRCFKITFPEDLGLFRIMSDTRVRS